MSHPIKVWGPCLTSAAPPGGGNPQGLYPTRGSAPTYSTQIESLIVPPPHKTSM